MGEDDAVRQRIAAAMELERSGEWLAAIETWATVVEERDVFKFSNGSDGLHYNEALDCFAVFELEGRRLALSDVVARELPSIDELLAEIESPTDQVEFHFSPDRFDVDARPEIFRYDSDCYMVRGPFEAEGRPFMVPPPARH